MSAAVAPPVRAELEQRTRRVLKRGRGIKPDVLLVETPTGAVVVKDYAPRVQLVRRALGPWLVRREQRVHRALEQVAAVPALLGAIDELAFAVEYREGEPISRTLAARVGPERVARFLAALEASVEAMHDSGVVHLDLRHRDNVLMDAEATPVLVDFAAAMCFRPGSFWYRWYRPTVLVYDRRALAKWRERLRPGAHPSRRSLWKRLGRSSRSVRNP